MSEKTAWQETLHRGKKKPSYIYSIISMVLVLFLLGFFGMAILQAQQMIRVYKEKIDIIVEIKPQTGRVSILELKKRLQAKNFVLPKSVRFISKEEGAKMLKEEIGEDFMNLDFQNPLFDLLLFNVSAKNIQNDSLSQIRKTVMNEPEVRDVFYQEAMIENIERNINKVGLILLLLSLLFVIITITLIHNTIRLALYANRFLIKNMELVGASWNFISWPYLKKSIINGFISGLIAVSLLMTILYTLQKDLPELQNSSYLSSFGLLFGFLVLFGIIISLSSTYYVVNKYLRMRVDDIYQV